MASTGWDWVFHALGWALAGLGLLLALWALFWDRSRGRKRCSKCWYSMEGAKEDKAGACVCPECGKVIADDRTLHRTRRRPRWVAISLMVWIVGYAVFVTPAVRRDGWVAVIPTSVLIVLASPERLKEIAFNPTWNPKVPFDYEIENELVRRGEEPPVYGWQVDFLAWRIRRAADASADAAEFTSYDISPLFSPLWWRSPIRFDSNDRAQIWTEFFYMWVSLVIPESWVFNGGADAALIQMGNRLFVWAPKEQQRIVALDLALLIAEGDEGMSAAPYWAFDEELRSSFEIRIYDVSDLAPPSVERFEEPPPDPNEYIQWGYFDGELMLHSQGIFDLIDDIVNNVESDYWVENGGKDAMILTVPGRLIITASTEMHDRVAQRLDSLREARKSETDGTP